MRKLTLKNDALDHCTIKSRAMSLNDDMRIKIAAKIRPHGVFSNKLCMGAVGSDGRLEKGDMSPLEVVLYHREINPAKVRELVELMNSLLESESHPITDGSMEAKSVVGDEMNYAFGDHRRPYPSRIMDSYPIFGNAGMLELAKLKMLDEWNSPSGKKIIKAIKERRKEARRVMLTGRQRWKGQDVYHFNLECGRAFYANEEGFQIRSVKPGPLRFVQSAIEAGMVVLGRDLLRQGKRMAMARTLNDLPTPTIDKLRYLDGLGVVTLHSSDIEKVCDSYLSFLKIYHASESAFVDGERIVRFDQQEARERVELLSRLLEKPLIRE